VKSFAPPAAHRRIDIYDLAPEIESGL